MWIDAKYIKPELRDTRIAVWIADKNGYVWAGWWRKSHLKAHMGEHRFFKAISNQVCTGVTHWAFRTPPPKEIVPDHPYPESRVKYVAD